MAECQANLWTAYPMAPQLRNYLGIQADEYTGDRSAAPDDKTLADFRDYLLAELDRRQIETQDHFVDLIEELTSMGLPSVAIKLADTHTQFSIDSDFRACLALGSSLMMERELGEATLLMNRAKVLAPMELAPYVNLANIAFAESRDQDAIESINQGFSIDPNSYRLWELFASILLDEDKASAGHKLRSKAEEINSFAGLSLAAEIIDPNDHLLKAQMLEEAFNAGARDDDFLIEYTAALGMAQQYEKIPQLIYRVEHIEKKKIHWKLYAHAAQAYLAMNKEVEAAVYIEKAKLSQDMPANVLADLVQVYDEQLAPH